MHVCIYVRTYVGVYVYMYPHICVSVYVYVWRACMHVCLYVGSYVSIHVHVSLYVRKQECFYVCMQTHSSKTSCQSGFGRPRHCFRATVRAHANDLYAPHAICRVRLLPESPYDVTRENYTLQRIARRCNKLQHICRARLLPESPYDVTREYYTLQRTATHCNTSLATDSCPSLPVT